jgi:hypothetical protein
VCWNEIVKTVTPQFGRTEVQPTDKQIAAWYEQSRVQASMMSLDSSAPFCNLDACAPVIGSRCRFFDWCHGSGEARALHYTTPDERASEAVEP